MKLLIPVVFTVVLLFATFLIVKVHTTAIVNGQPSNFDEFPFMAALGWINNETGKEDFLCGGVLIAPTFVLTAAHCLFFHGKLPDVIKVGGNYLNSPNNEVHSVKAHFIYPEYNNAQAYNDIALLQLNGISKKRRVYFPTQSFNERDAIAIGYGTTQFAGSRTEILQKVDLTIMPEKDCQRYFKRKRKFKSGISPSHICAGDPQGYHDTCQGDSGGPLLVQHDLLVGITSVGQACSGNPPAVYTRVSSFIKWIRETLSLV